MTFQCQFCLRFMYIALGHTTVCQCGARYSIQTVGTNTTAITLAFNKDYDALHQQAVPKAFYDAFEEKELQP